MSLLVPDNVADVTPSNTVDEAPAGVLFIGTGGDVKITAAQSGTATFKNVPNGSMLRVRAKRIFDTLTTASDIIKLY